MTVEGTRLDFTNLLDTPHGDIRFMVDNSSLQKGVSAGLEIIGWVIHRKHKIAGVSLTSENGILATAKLDVHRPLVSKHFTRFYNSESAGFKLVVTSRPQGVFFLDITLENGKTMSIGKFELVVYDQRKLLFMHIAKAAGSTVNTFFANHYPEDQYAVHIESSTKWQSNPDDLKNLSFLSGHVSLYMLNKKLNLEDYYKATVIREPFSQLCSHLAWIKRLSMPGEELRFNKHAVPIQTFAKKLSDTNFSNPESLKVLFDSLTGFEKRLIDNCQVRYFTWLASGESVGEKDAQKAIKASAVFDKIGITESIDNFMKDVAHDMSWPEPDDCVRVNVTQNFYGLDLSKSETRAILWPMVKHDMALYEHVKASQTRSN